MEQIIRSSSRSVRFPLKLKLLATMIVLIACSLLVFVVIALKIFRDDKSAYIFETLLGKAESGRVILSQKLLSGGRSSLSVRDQKVYFGESDVTEKLLNLLSEASSYRLNVIIPVNNELMAVDGTSIKILEGPEKTLLIPVLSAKLTQGVKELEIAGEKVLYAYDFSPELNFIYTASIPQKTAFAATTDLIQRSILYGIFILGAAMILSVLLARPLTSKLEVVTNLTREIALGNFKERIQVKGHDEVGVLGDSVNDMADKIVSYMEEMKEKTRLENEVAVAQLVQSSFFPRPVIELPELKLAAHFEPASECGGDWWSSFTVGDWTVLFIADATGHGVPAALLTATINCCKSSLGFMLEFEPKLLSRPDEILRYMNHAVSEAGKEIQVTCFVGCYHRPTKEFVYSNASHTPPLLYNSQDGDLTRESFVPLLEGKGPRLGEAASAHFSAHHRILKTHDTIFFYTDGIIEAQDPQGNRWGERRMLKSIMKSSKSDPEILVQEVFRDLGEYMAGKPKDDDHTAFALKVLA